MENIISFKKKSFIAEAMEVRNKIFEYLINFTDEQKTSMFSEHFGTSDKYDSVYQNIIRESINLSFAELTLGFSPDEELTETIQALIAVTSNFLEWLNCNKHSVSKFNLVLRFNSPREKGYEDRQYLFMKINGVVYLIDIFIETENLANLVLDHLITHDIMTYDELFQDK